MARMDKLIAVDQLIKDAKKKGLDFGKGDPYNRLRYYTKIGWLPHMVRKQDKSGTTRGHYPEWVVDRLLQIEDYKNSGLSNDEITKKLSSKTKIRELNELLTSKETRQRIITYLVLIVGTFVVAAGLGIIPIEKPRNNIIQNTQVGLPKQILDTGTSYIPQNQRKAFIRTDNITSTSKVYVSFNEDYSPASRYWVSDIISLNGFYVNLDTPASRNVEFSWWVTN